MKTLTEQLTQYATYHRDRRNIATHFVGIPMIVVASAALMARAGVAVGGVPLSLASLVVLASIVFYLRMDLRFGLTMAVLFGGALALGTAMAAQSWGMWLATSVGTFVLGWVFQFVGHFWEGKKPAFVDDLIGLLVGPLFVVAETAFALGLRSELHAEIVRLAGPTRATTERKLPTAAAAS